MRPPVLSKADFVRRFLANEFGNRGPTWDSLNDFERSGYTGLVHLRNRVAGGPTWYNIPANQVQAKWLEICHNTTKVVEPWNIYFAGMAPTERTLIQGEAMESERGLALYYSTVRKPMREALAEEAVQEYGLTAILRLQYYLDPSSYDDLRMLLGEYDGHVVEFSTYEVCWGTVPNRNTVFWEIRGY